MSIVFHINALNFLCSTEIENKAQLMKIMLGLRKPAIR